MKAGCGRLSLNVTSSSPWAITVSRLPYHVLRGLTRSVSLALPCSRSQVHLTSPAVNGSPSCHLTPRRSLKVRLVPAASHDHSRARSGTIDFIPLCGTLWSYMTRLLRTPIIGPRPAIVAASRSDVVAGLSKKQIFRMPPGFCALAEPIGAAASAMARPARRTLCVRFTCPSTFEMSGAENTSGEDDRGSAVLLADKSA